MGSIKYYPTTSVQHAFMCMTDSNVIWGHFVNGTDCLACSDVSANAERSEKEMDRGLYIYISIFSRKMVCHSYSKVNSRSRWLIHCYIRPIVRRTLLAVMSKTVQYRITFLFPDRLQMPVSQKYFKILVTILWIINLKLNVYTKLHSVTFNSGPHTHLHENLKCFQHMKHQ